MKSAPQTSKASNNDSKHAISVPIVDQRPGSVVRTSGNKFDRKSPSHGDVVGEYARADASDVDAAVHAAREAFDKGPWPWTPGAERMKVLLRATELIRQQKQELALIETLEAIPKPL